MTISPDRDLTFLHRFKQRRLGLWRRSVDLIRQHNVGEQRSLHETEIAMTGRTIFFHDLRAGDVGGHQVGCELNATERKVQRLGQRADHQRLGQTGYSLQHHVTATEQANQDLVDDGLLSDDDLAQLFENFLSSLVQPSGIGFADHFFSRHAVILGGVKGRSASEVAGSRVSVPRIPSNANSL